MAIPVPRSPAQRNQPLSGVATTTGGAASPGPRWPSTVADTPGSSHASRSRWTAACRSLDRAEPGTSTAGNPLPSTGAQLSATRRPPAPVVAKIAASAPEMRARAITASS